MTSTWIDAPPKIALQDDAVHVWLVNTQHAPADMHAVLSAAEQARAMAFHTERDRIRFVAAHIALRHVLAQYVPLDPAHIEFAKGTYGKPSIAQPTRVQFNLAHSGDLALIGVVLDAAIGVDVEAVRAMSDLTQIAERFFAPNERRSLFALPADEQTTAFFRIWTRKEAYIKATGEGLRKPLDAFDVSVNDVPRLLRDADDADAPTRWMLCDTPSLSGYAAAIAVERRYVATHWYRF